MHKLGRILVLVALAGVVGAGPAHAVPLMFPADQALVPVAVAGAFALPALLAALFASLRGLLRSVRWMISLALIAAVAAAVFGYLNPEILPTFRF
ncbi:MAG: hypothetical protein ACKVP7_02610 [Hyphomicrobiaceae bacterium]